MITDNIITLSNTKIGFCYKSLDPVIIARYIEFFKPHNAPNKIPGEIIHLSLGSIFLVLDSRKCICGNKHCEVSFKKILFEDKILYIAYDKYLEKIVEEIS